MVHDDYILATAKEKPFGFDRKLTQRGKTPNYPSGSFLILISPKEEEDIYAMFNKV